MSSPFAGDLYRYGGQTGFLAASKAFIRYPGLRILCLKRICSSFSAFSPLGFIARIYYKRLQVKYGFQIPHVCKIGSGLFLGHYGGIVINAETVIGRDCNIAQGVTLGRISKGPKTGAPVIGNQVWIGANAVIVGKIRIGDNCLIAPLSYVNFDVPSNSTVIGNPGIIHQGRGSGGYINNVYDPG